MTSNWIQQRITTFYTQIHTGQMYIHVEHWGASVSKQYLQCLAKGLSAKYQVIAHRRWHVAKQDTAPIINYYCLWDYLHYLQRVAKVWQVKHIVLVLCYWVKNILAKCEKFALAFCVCIACGIFRPVQTCGLIRELVDCLCRDGADTQYMQYLSKSRITSPQTR